MKKLSFIWLCLFGFFLGATGQTGLPNLDKEQLEGVKITRNQVFSGNSLWGYINGGADLYLEYGFDKIRVIDLEVENEDIKIDLYKMEDAVSAYGIFSINRFECDQRAKNWMHSCITDYQVQLATGPFYLSIINQSGSNEAINASLKLAEALLEDWEDKQLEFPGLPGEPFTTEMYRNMKITQGRLGMTNGFHAWNSYFEGLENYTLMIIPVKSDNAVFNLAYLREAETGAIEKLQEQILKHNHQSEWYMAKTDKAFILLENKTPTKNITEYRKAIEKEANTSLAPL